MVHFLSSLPHLDGAKVHGLLDDVMVVTKIQGRGVHRLQEGPNISLREDISL